MDAVSLVCKSCGKPLALISFDDGVTKGVGCASCGFNPVVSHVDLNKVFDKISLMAPEKQDCLELACSQC